MKIDGPGAGRLGAASRGRASTPGDTKAKAQGRFNFLGLFKEVLPTHAAENFVESDGGVSKWMLDLDEAGRQMESAGTVDAYQKYKAVVKRLLSWAEKRAFELEMDPGRLRMVKGQAQPTGARVILRTVDAELESLLGMVQRQEKDRLAVADKVVRIRGLILDVLR